MRKLLFRNGDGRFGAIGIGAMIVFIAMVLVAGVAASVIINSSNAVQIQALDTGQETTKEVSSGLCVFEIAGKVNGTNDLNNLSITVKARPGSGDIDINNSYILMSDGTSKSLLRYNYVNASLASNEALSSLGQTFVTKASANGDLFEFMNESAWANLNNETFGMAVIQDYDSSVTAYNPVINRGDKVALFIRCGAIPRDYAETWGGHFTYGLFGREIPERTDVFGRVIPEVGAPGVISFTAPMSYVDTIYTLQ